MDGIDPAKEPMKPQRLSLFSRTILVCVTATLAAVTAGPQPKGPTPKGSCAVCGMQVAHFPDWAASVSFKDGAQAWFDGPKDLFIYLSDLKQYAPKQKPSDLTVIQVKDYYGRKYLDGRKAFYVIGSDVLGPMGKELVPCATEAGARDFLKDHRGQRILTFQEISPVLLKSME
jgi:nitrous oxide reductase accessory protein NosL